MRRKSLAGVDCSVAQALEVVGDPWTLLVVRDALFGVRRFDDFHRRLGIARNTLADRLASLVDHGVLDRVPYQDSPLRHEYRLTDKGRDLSEVVIALLRWGDRWRTAGDPPVVLVDPETGERVEPVYVDRHTGRTLREIGARPVPGPGATDPRHLPGPGSRLPGGR